MTSINSNRPIQSLKPRTPATPPAAPDDPTVDLQGSACPGLTASQKVGSVDPSQPMQLSIILKPQEDFNVPDGPFKTVSRSHHDPYTASGDSIDDIKAFAKKNGLTVAGVDPNTRTVSLQGPAGNVSKAFGVQLGEYKDASGTEFQSYQGSIKLPKSLAGGVQGVFGLENRPFAHTPIILRRANDGDSGYNPADVASMYNFPKGTDGTGQTIGLIELGGGYKDSDTQQYFQQLGMKAPSVTAVSVDGAQNAPTGDADGPDGEVALDIDVAGAAAPGAKIAAYFAPNTEQGFVDAINQAIHDKVNHPDTLSISWGAPESQWTQQGLTNLNNVLKDAASMGINVYAAAGDNGSADGETDKKDHADFPASSPWAIGTGGTNLQSQDGRVTKETVWNDAGGGATGGGFSTVFPAPDWQIAHGTLPQSPGGPGGRGVPDVAGDASPQTGYKVFVDGTNAVVGGTSAVAPLWAALTSRLQQGVGAPVGFLPPVLYQHPEDFNNITEGNNGDFQAGAGWNPTTGLGSPDGDKLLATLQALRNSQAA